MYNEVDKGLGSTTCTENVAPLPASWLHHSGQYKYEYTKRVGRLQTGLTSKELDDYKQLAFR
jgi:hypothetical protein